MIKIFAKHVSDEMFNMKKDEEDLMETLMTWSHMNELLTILMLCNISFNA